MRQANAPRVASGHHRLPQALMAAARRGILIGLLLQPFPHLARALDHAGIGRHGAARTYLKPRLAAIQAGIPEPGRFAPHSSPGTPWPGGSENLTSPGSDALGARIVADSAALFSSSASASPPDQARGELVVEDGLDEQGPE